MIRKIVFIGDLLRCQNNNTGFADRSLGWEYYLFKEQIYQATGINPEVYYSTSIDKFNLFKFYELCNYEVSMDNWISIACENYTQEAKEYTKECFQDTLVITQVGGALLKVLDSLNIPYIDIYVSAFKFLEDIHFAFRTNIPEIRQKLTKYTFNENHLYIYANYIKGYYWAANRREFNVEPDSLLLLGQTDIDLSLIKDNKLVDFSCYKEEIQELCSKYNKVYYKPHPYAKGNNKNEVFIRNIDNICIVDTNFYKLMLEENIIATAALSSGTLSEAKYFSKEANYISHKFVNYCFDKNPTKEDFILVDDAYYSPIFWKDILSCVVEVRDCTDFNFKDKANILRNSLDVSWGYEITSNEIKNLKEEIERNKQEHIIFNQNQNLLRENLIRRTKAFKSLRRILSCFVPCKKLRKQIRGDI